jgi:hypothetical protein
MVSAAGAQLLPPHSALPSDEECAARVVPTSETRPGNTQFNYVKPTAQQLAPFYSHPLQFNGPPNSSFFRVDGNYVGTTDMEIQWAACKWGMDADMLRAQSVIESGQNQAMKGDKYYSHDLCTGGNGWDFWQPSGYCYTSYSLVQIKTTNYNFSPMAWESTPAALDFRGAYWRACVNGEIAYYADNPPLPGYPTYPNGTAEEMAVGCTGSWFSGRWYDEASLTYLDRWKQAMKERSWEPPAWFSEPQQKANVSGTVGLRISYNAAKAHQCVYACVSTDMGFLTCEQKDGVYQWDSTHEVPNGLHVITADIYSCEAASNGKPTGWPQPSLTLNVANGGAPAAVHATSTKKGNRQHEQRKWVK